MYASLQSPKTLGMSNYLLTLIHTLPHKFFFFSPSLSAKTNVQGTLNVLDLSKRCNKLQCIVYVSTISNNWYRDSIEEQVHPPPFLVDEYFSALASTNKSTLKKFLKKSEEYFPNHYGLSKCVAEYLCVKHGIEVPAL